ncbi:hypothetical protein [Haloarcula marina]|uniref:hypothetical protein n=1 Tax=Haloarcula marina TaxID=2961574 RepID=UPI0020B7D3B6|nr:hypothetical protein [Halomicroarcula marina]
MRIRRAAAIHRQNGSVGLLKKGFTHLYNRLVRPWLPVRGPHPEFNGIAVGGALGPDSRAPHLFDSVVPWSTPAIHSMPDYEVELLAAIESQVDPGDKVVIVGGGNGISTVRAAQLAGPDGHVLTYEGNRRRVSAIQNTAALNDVADRVQVEHAIVGPPKEIVGNDYEADGATHIEPATIPPCNVLEMDCEGSEREIIRDLKITPQIIIVETHPAYDTPVTTISTELADLGYTVVNTAGAVPAEDIYILTAERMPVTDVGSDHSL